MSNEPSPGDRRAKAAGARIAEKLNLDEAAVPGYSLPDPLQRADGSPVPDASAWYGAQREALLELFRSHVYGRSPGTPEALHATLRDSATDALEGRAIRKQWSVVLTPKAPPLELLLYLPPHARRPARRHAADPDSRPTVADTAVPVFLGLNFHGNHTIHPDPAIHLTERWVPDRHDGSTHGHRAAAAGRGASRSRWPVEEILSRGYGLATAYCGDLEADRDAARPDGIRAVYTNDPTLTWGAVAAWAWGLSRALDVLAGESAVRSEQVLAIGHSRLGKAALWAAAQDPRFAAAISNDSGCLGAALSRRRFGETVEFIQLLFPHWFTTKLRDYADREDALPVDQHTLLSLIAPRPLYVASAQDDGWADPRGEFLAALEASRVYRFLGEEGLTAQAMPPVDTPVCGRVAYHLRSGGHDLTAADWRHFLDFADRFAR